jgi:hypothetical protein
MAKGEAVMPAPLTDYEYASFAKLYELTTLSNCKNSVVVLAMHLNLPCSTIKERIRTSRRKGFLTEPGKGRRALSFTTDKTKQLLEGE